MKGDQRYSEEKTKMNLARLRQGGEEFQVVIHPEEAMAYRTGNTQDLKAALYSEKIFADAHKGMLASEHTIEAVFGTKDRSQAISQIIRKGEIQLTAEYREKQREAKRKWLIHLIHRNAVDPKTGLPHPPQRIGNAMEEAKVHIDDHKKAEDQMQDILKKIRTILPIKFETREIWVNVPAHYASKAHTTMKSYGTITEANWQSDGSLISTMELPAGMQQEFFDALNRLTHGNCETKVMKTK